MNDFRTRFTKWYYRKGYRMTYKLCDAELIFYCPWWVRPLVEFFFSPCVYFDETGSDYITGFEMNSEGRYVRLQKFVDTEHNS